MAAEMKVLEALQTVIDPEVGIDIVNLGLVVEVRVESGRVGIDLIMTSVACPMHADLARQAREAVAEALGSAVAVEVQVLEAPPWGPERMSPQARRLLGW